MKVGDIPNEVYNRRNQVHRLVEMEEMNLKNDENVHQSLIYEENQKKPKVSQSEPVGFLARMFGMSKSKPEQKEEEYKPTELKDHYNLYDEDWFDAQRNIIQKSQETSTADGNNEIIHLICPDDTIEGLELQYGVPACRIRTYNNLQTNDIFYLKKLSIPNPTSDNKKQEINMEKYMQELKIGLFLDAVCQPEDKNRKVAIFYLDMNNWNYMKATQEYLDDYKFELQQHKAKKVSTHKAQA
ncbi:unnamed protein product (macronuclear) [Paramecium tetraurelia]|uniref:LysM domain-containing protein n=1 Tax=Paramecium tetraurelia TaxID=5888 RepID=A0BYC4_PARTE|nr:uncharacterized protein GSPATT00033394001 [Paramecium tetraurelia]CAK63541.1 unnamed protein product [Paramecium tetraurelia]|eukprot:XP_001430939.1 hypothetical protein (macronuclear) [Paramecium tetraurelia strain d4-2]